MITRYANDYKHNYLVIQDDRVLRNDYRLKMMTENKVPGLLSCQDRMINGEGLLYYDITSLQPLKELFAEKRMTMDDIKLILNYLRELCERMQRFLLYGDGLLLEPEFIYMDIESRSYSFLYYPFGEEGTLLKLLDFMTEHVDSEDMDAVEASYQMADLFGRSHYTMDETLGWFFNEYPEEEDVTPSENKSEIKDSDYAEWERGLYEEKEEERRNNKDERKNSPKISIWDRIKTFLFGKEEDNETSDIEFDEFPEYEESPYSSEPNGGANTVFIPWVENCEHKLYGLEKKNKYHIDLTRAPFTIGKLEGAVDMVLNDQSISRMHAKIVRQSGKYYLQDLNSTNGSFHNGLRLKPNERVEISPGDEIGFGRLKFIYR